MNKMETERKRCRAKGDKPAKNMDTEHNERPPQSKASKTVDK